MFANILCLYLEGNFDECFAEILGLGEVDTLQVWIWENHNSVFLDFTRWMVSRLLDAW